MPPPTDQELRRDALTKEYGEVANNFRLLTDIRFRLLAFLPIAAGAAAVLRGTDAQDATAALGTLGISLFGLAVTAGLVSYNARNDQLYNELVGRAGNIERSLGLPDGAFANRPTPWLSIKPPFGRPWPVEHGTSVALIYGASFTLWLFLVFSSAAQLAYPGEDQPAWCLIAGTLVAAIVVIVGVARGVKKQKTDRQKVMRAAAEAAYRIVNEGNPKAAAVSPQFLTLCAGLRDSKFAASDAFRAALRNVQEPPAPTRPRRWPSRPRTTRSSSRTSPL